MIPVEYIAVIIPIMYFFIIMFACLLQDNSSRRARTVLFSIVLLGVILAIWVPCAYHFSSRIIISTNNYPVKHIDTGNNCKKAIIIKDEKIIDLSEKINCFPPENSTVEFTKFQLVGLGLKLRVEEEVKVINN